MGLIVHFGVNPYPIWGIPIGLPVSFSGRRVTTRQVSAGVAGSVELGQGNTLWVPEAREDQEQRVKNLWLQIQGLGSRFRRLFVRFSFYRVFLF